MEDALASVCDGGHESLYESEVGGEGEGGGAVIGTSEAFSPLTLTNHLAVHFVTRAATDSPSCSWTLVWQEGNLVRLWDWGGGVGAGRGIFNTH